MSRRRGTQHRRPRSGRRHRSATDDRLHGVIVAWCATEDDLPAARQQTHDAVIRMLGHERVGGVTWRQATGDEAVELLGVVREGATGEVADGYRRVGGHLREYGGWVVIASAPSRRVTEP